MNKRENIRQNTASLYLLRCAEETTAYYTWEYMWEYVYIYNAILYYIQKFLNIYRKHRMYTYGNPFGNISCRINTIHCAYKYWKLLYDYICGRKT
jgi:hypothetical protein